ncbi:MAG: F0F1 ATP synthase subunit A, partial [Chloroflexota bacterium]|nr:F0F1 ATP synthase subunit A [Chloroflexota bacterium]
MGTKGKIAIALVIAVALIVIGVVLFPVPEPGVHLAANYGGGGGEPFAKLGPIYVTNTLITSWITVLLLVVLFFAATRNMKLVPKGLQNLAEMAIEMLLGFVEGVAGKENGRRFFPIVATIFLYVLFNAWMGLLPFFNFVT